jgi:hypothetical protein
MTLIFPLLKETAFVTSSYLHFVITPIVMLPEPAILILLGGGLCLGKACAKRSQRLASTKQPSKLKFLSSGKPLNPQLPMLWDTQFTLLIDAK